MFGTSTMTLDDLVSQLRAAHGEGLIAVLVYGSTAASPAATRGHNVAVVVRSLGVREREAGGAIARAWEEAGNPVPLVMTEAEWTSSVDVFAIEHADIAERHRILVAAPGFTVAGPEAVRPADIRRQLEYELLAQLLGLRAAISRAGSDSRAQRAILSAEASRASALMRAALRLSGRAVPSSAPEVCVAAGALAQFDPRPFVDALRQRHGEGDVPKAELPATLAGVHDGLARLVAFVDAIPEGPAA